MLQCNSMWYLQDILSCYNVTMIKIFYAALIATWLNREEKGFRQRDVKFYHDLIIDWMETSPSAKNYTIQNTQMMRFLESLVKKQWLLKKKGTTPYYTFNNKYFMDLIKESLSISEDDPYDLFFLQFHLASVYKETLSELLFIRGIELSRGQKMDLEHLFNSKLLLRSQKERIEIEINKLDLRKKEVEKMIEFAKQDLASGSDAMDVVGKIEKKYPYQMQYQKSMSKTFADLHPKLRILELTSNSEKRLKTLWDPTENYLRGYLKTLEELS